ncbi:uncharacterized protein LOC143032700 [Oratosquilla oratoria]|uniref:uncharacterized protein LOC143032700 n=1 Tax=Oratosquilla oratoria TaxID=337810 RepID=UPI003F765D5A
MVFSIRQIQEKSQEYSFDLHLDFIDLTKAFDIVNRELLWSALHKFGTPYKFLNFLKSFHEGMNACVLAGMQKSEHFTVEMGVKQGCVLAPVVFNLFLTAVTTLSHNNLNDNNRVRIQ